MGILTSRVALEAAGLSAWKPPVDVVAVANVASLSGLQTIDGVTGAEGLSVLLTAQTAGLQNGPYLMSAGSWTRRYDMDISSEAVLGSSWRATQGTLAGRRYYLSAPTGTITLNSTALTFSEEAGGGVGSDPSVTSLTASSFVAIGGSPSTTGALRMTSNGAIRYLAGAAEVDAILVDASGNVVVGDSADATSITEDVKAAGTWRLRVAGNERAKLEEVGTGGKLTLANGAAFTGGSSLNINSPTLVIDAGSDWYIETAGVVQIRGTPTGLGFYAAAPVAKPTVTGSRGGNAALASLLTALANLGLITDSSS
jgi:hypothetical protein